MKTIYFTAMMIFFNLALFFNLADTPDYSIINLCLIGVLFFGSRFKDATSK